MKKILLGAVIIAAGAAMAADSTQFGILTVPSSARQTIVSVPWLESTTTNAAVCVSNLVLTSGLEDGDYLKYYNGSSYECWELKTGTGGKYWQSVKQEDEDTGDWVNSENPSTAALARGKAIILDRCGGDSSRVLGNCFYIMGKPTSGTSKLDLECQAYCLVAPTNLDSESVKISDLEWEGLEGQKEYLYVFDGSSKITYRYFVIDSVGTWINVKNGDRNGTIPRGTGAWFYSYGDGTTTKSVTL